MVWDGEEGSLGIIVGCLRKTAERYSERKWARFIPTRGAMEEFLRKATRSRVKKTGFLETAPWR